MSFSSNVVSLDKLRSAITASYPGIDQQLMETFMQHDIAGDGMLPFSVVELLLRHFLVKCGLGDYMSSITDKDGKMVMSRLSPYLSGTPLEGIEKFSDDRMMSLDDMSTMAIIWLKIISDVYMSEESSKSNQSIVSTSCCGSTDYVTQGTTINDILSSDAHSDNPLQTIVDLSDGPQYMDHINDEVEEEEIRQKNMENYIQTLVNEAAMNRSKGVKCFVYPAAATLNGSCVSAGAAMPQRRPRPKEYRKPTAGCC